jgi:hypothetical protein
MSKPSLRKSSLFLVPAVFALWQFVTLPAACASTSLGKKDASFFGIVTSVADAQVSALSVGEKERPSRDRDQCPAPTSDQDLIDDGPDESPADHSARQDEGTAPFLAADPAELSLRAPRIIRTLLLPSTLALQNVREHSRERAPPTLE